MNAVVVGWAFTAGKLEDLVAKLVQTRLSMELTQKDMAERMGITQPVVSEFERCGAAPKVSTVVRYAEALGGTLSFRVDFPVTETDNGQ